MLDIRVEHLLFILVTKLLSIYVGRTAYHLQVLPPIMYGQSMILQNHHHKLISSLHPENKEVNPWDSPMKPSPNCTTRFSRSNNLRQKHQMNVAFVWRALWKVTSLLTYLVVIDFIVRACIPGYKLVVNALTVALVLCSTS